MSPNIAGIFWSISVHSPDFSAALLKTEVQLRAVISESIFHILNRTGRREPLKILNTNFKMFPKMQEDGNYSSEG